MKYEEEKTKERLYHIKESLVNYERNFYKQNQNI